MSWITVLILAVSSILAIIPAHAQLDETCTVTINGQTVNSGFGGEFQINNIPVVVNLVRAYAVCTKNSKTRYGPLRFFSDY